MSSGVSSQAACDLEGGRPGQRFGSSPLLTALEGAGLSRCCQGAGRRRAPARAATPPEGDPRVGCLVVPHHWFHCAEASQPILEHGEEGSMPTGGKRLSRSHGNERPSTPAALRSGDLTCSFSAVLSPPVMSLRSQWPSLGFCPASGLHHLLSIARARRGSPVGKPPLPPLAR